MTGAGRYDRAAILQLIPQQGAMCLLEEILDWDPQRLLARGTDPRAPGHPLRAHGRLGSAVAIEYAAQCAAAHGALLGASPPAAVGAARTLIASTRDVRLDDVRLDGLSLGAPGTGLLIEVRRVHAAAAGALYEFALPADQPTARGRLSLLVA